MTSHQDVLNMIEVHDADALRQYFASGGDPNEINEGIPLFTMMIEMYTRTPRFKNCIRTFVDYGLLFEDKALLSVLLDDAETLNELIFHDPAIVSKMYTQYNNTYTPLTGGTLLHFCAEYNAAACARVLYAYGADLNTKAALDEYGFGGHTPIFHTVNQNSNNSADMLHFLLENGADLRLTVKGLIWGKGYEWETFIPAVNPVSYAMMGLLPQMHRKDITVAQTVSLLIKYAYEINYTPGNVPCRYLMG